MVESKERQKKSPWSALSIALDLVAVACLYGIALSLRLIPPEAVTIDADWDWFIRVSNEYITDMPRIGFVQFLYTSLPCLYYGAVTYLFDDILINFRVYAAIEALAVPLTYLALRVMAGAPAGIFGALIIAFSAADITLGVGLKSPYWVSASTAILCLGVWGAFNRRVWGPPFMVLGGAGAVSMHIGLWLMSIWVSLIAVVACFFLAKKQRLMGLISTVVTGLFFLIPLILLDYENLKTDVENLAVQGPPQLERPPMEAIIDRMHFGIGLPPETLDHYLLALKLGGLTLLWHLFQLFRRWRDPSRQLNQQTIGALSGAFVVTVALTGLSHYAYLVHKNGYLEYHHMVAFTPILVIMAGGLLQGAIPLNFRPLHGLIPLILFIPWSEDVYDKYRLDTERRMRIPPDNSHLDFVLSVVEPIRADARGRQVQPVIYTYFPKTRDHRPTIIANVVNEFARQGYAADALPESCYVVMPQDAPLDLTGYHGVVEVEKYALRLLAFDGCAALGAQDAAICDATSGYRVRARRRLDSATVPQAFRPKFQLSCEDGIIGGPGHHGVDNLGPGDHGPAQGPPLGEAGGPQGAAPDKAGGEIAPGPGHGDGPQGPAPGEKGGPQGPAPGEKGGPPLP